MKTIFTFALCCLLPFVVFANSKTHHSTDLIIYRALENPQMTLFFTKSLTEAGTYDYLEQTKICKDKSCLLYNDILIAKPAKGMSKNYFGITAKYSGSVNWEIMGKKLELEVVEVMNNGIKQTLYFEQKMGLICIQLSSKEHWKTYMLTGIQGITL